MGIIRCENGHLFSQERHGSICPYCSTAVNMARNKGEDVDGIPKDATAVCLEESEIIYPVVGWLVCIEGASKGKDYRLIAEKNFIGRSPEMNIQILGDNHISYKNHAIVSYDGKKRAAFLLPGDAQGLVYLNGEAVCAPVQMEAFDKIELGKSKLLFMPLCGSNFEWGDEDE